MIIRTVSGGSWRPEKRRRGGRLRVRERGREAARRWNGGQEERKDRGRGQGRGEGKKEEKEEG
jgi:hypothetical protein